MFVPQSDPSSLVMNFRNGCGSQRQPLSLVDQTSLSLSCWSNPAQNKSDWTSRHQKADIPEDCRHWVCHVHKKETGAAIFIYVDHKVQNHLKYRGCLELIPGDFGSSWRICGAKHGSWLYQLVKSLWFVPSGETTIAEGYMDISDETVKKVK